MKLKFCPLYGLGKYVSSFLDSLTLTLAYGRDSRLHHLCLLSVVFFKASNLFLFSLMYRDLQVPAVSPDSRANQGRGVSRAQWVNRDLRDCPAIGVSLVVEGSQGHLVTLASKVPKATVESQVG